MSNDDGREIFGKLLSAWHNNNGVQGFCDYFEWGGYSRVYHRMAEVTETPVKKLLLRDWCRFKDHYVEEWWNVWKTGSLTKVYFRSDGSIYDWLLSIAGDDQ
jgi:hypothetical protein